MEANLHSQLKGTPHCFCRNAVRFITDNAAKGMGGTQHGQGFASEERSRVR